MDFYNKNIKEELSVRDRFFFEEWYKIVEEILLNKEFQVRKLFMHHHDVTVFEHSVEVSYDSFIVAKYFNADERVCAIAGLLHDFYSKAWIYTLELAAYDTKYLSELVGKKPLFKKHGFTHAFDASVNYVKYFPHLEDKKITNSIKRHMFPLNICPPKYKEGWIITLVDKKNSMFELPSIKYVPKMVSNKITLFIKSRI